MDTGAILVGDAGGTNVRFALAHADAGRVTVSPIWKRPGADYATFSGALDAFLADTRPRLAGAAFGMAGAVRDGQVDLLHRSWSVDRRDIAAQLRVERVVVVNDFFTMARAAGELGADDLAEIAQGDADSRGALAVGGPGTGFGIGVLRRYRDGWIVVAGEGGHQTYSPQTDMEWRTAEALRARGIYVSNEVIASGSGFDETRRALAEVMGVPDPKLSQAAVIAAAERGDAFALEFCRLRARCVMTVMGNLALSASATGGVFLAGGVTQHLVPWLRERASLDRFCKRGPRTDFLKRIAIRLITSETAPLMGAAHLWLDEAERGWL
jgi:glucokinase